MLIIGLVLVTLLTVLWVILLIAVFGSMLASDDVITLRDVIQNGGITVLLLAAVWRLSLNIERRRVARSA